MRRQLTHRQHAALVFFCTALLGSIGLPFFREWPAPVHLYLLESQLPLRVSVVFTICTAITLALFRLFSPRIGQLSHSRWLKHPPAWLAVLVGISLVAVLDIFFPWRDDGYRAGFLEWFGYGVLPVLIVFVWNWWSDLPFAVRHVLNRQQAREERITGSIVTAETSANPPQPAPVAFDHQKLGFDTIESIELAPWSSIEQWLQRDTPTVDQDLFETRPVAERLSGLIRHGMRAIGIVGPHGAGKSTIINWIGETLELHNSEEAPLFVSRHSCWAFENSATAIREVLTDAVSQIGTKVDTFQIDALPESYRRTFSLGGDWVSSLTHLLLRTPDVLEEFLRLSRLLADLDARLVIVVEDVDRTSSPTFVVQELLAFLDLLKSHDRIAFILAGSVAPHHDIDFARLCDHIEILPPVRAECVVGLANRLFSQCFDDSNHFERIGNSGLTHELFDLSRRMMREFEEYSLADAICQLLATPRQIRHALARTLHAWRTLQGEIDFNHVLLVNVLRYGAPECFQFVLRRWDRLSRNPDERTGASPEQRELIRAAVMTDWTRTSENAEWSSAAASRVLVSILPATTYWLFDANARGHFGDEPQGVYLEKYWYRAVNESIRANEVPDQEILVDVRQWLQNEPGSTALVEKLTTSERYCETWEGLADHLFSGHSGRILDLCEQVIDRILALHRASATAESTGFFPVCRLAGRRVGLRDGNLRWSLERLSSAAADSLQLVHDIWYYYCAPSERAILTPDEALTLRQNILGICRDVITNDSALESRLNDQSYAAVYQLVYGLTASRNPILDDLFEWAWLGRHILTGVRRQSRLIAANCVILLGGRVDARNQVAIDRKVMEAFFPGEERDVLSLLEAMRSHIPERLHRELDNVLAAWRRPPTGIPDESVVISELYE